MQNVYDVFPSDSKMDGNLKQKYSRKSAKLTNRSRPNQNTALVLFLFYINK